MTRTRLLNQESDVLVGDAAVELMDEVGVGPEEGIPGLVRAIFLLAEMTSDPELALDEAVTLISDGLQEA